MEPGIPGSYPTPGKESGKGGRGTTDPKLPNSWEFQFQGRRDNRVIPEEIGFLGISEWEWLFQQDPWICGVFQWEKQRNPWNRRGLEFLIPHPLLHHFLGMG